MTTPNPQGIPAPIDQFRDPQGQAWPGPWNPYNCWAAGGSEGVRFATNGNVNPTPPSFRTKSGNLRRQVGWLSDVVKGALAYGLHEGMDDPYTASFKLYQGLGWARFVADKLTNPLLCFVVPTDYDQVPANLSQDPNFNGGHSVTVFGGTLRDEGHGVRSVLVHDPIHGKSLRWPLYVLEAAAEKIGRQFGLPKGTIYATQFRQAIPEPPPPPPPPPPPDPETPEEAVIRLTEELRMSNLARDAALEAQKLAETDLATADDKLDSWADYGATIRTTPQPGEEVATP